MWNFFKIHMPGSFSGFWFAKVRVRSRQLCFLGIGMVLVCEMGWEPSHRGFCLLKPEGLPWAGPSCAMLSLGCGEPAVLVFTSKCKSTLLLESGELTKERLPAHTYPRRWTGCGYKNNVSWDHYWSSFYSTKYIHSSATFILIMRWHS